MFAFLHLSLFITNLHMLKLPLKYNNVFNAGSSDFFTVLFFSMKSKVKLYDTRTHFFCIMYIPLEF